MGRSSGHARVSPKERLARAAVGATSKSGRVVERARVERGAIWLTWEGWGLAPFREASYSDKEVEALLRGEW